MPEWITKVYFAFIVSTLRSFLFARFFPCPFLLDPQHTHTQFYDVQPQVILVESHNMVSLTGSSLVHLNNFIKCERTHETFFFAPFFSFGSTFEWATTFTRPDRPPSGVGRGERETNNSKKLRCWRKCENETLPQLAFNARTMFLKWASSGEMWWMKIVWEFHNIFLRMWLMVSARELQFKGS